LKMVVASGIIVFSCGLGQDVLRQAIEYNGTVKLSYIFLNFFSKDNRRKKMHGDFYINTFAVCVIFFYYLVNTSFH